MAATKLIFAGFGGQGVLSMGMIMAYGAMEQGLSATFMPAYGPEMRGGTANCHVVVSDKEVASPLISSPDILVAMNRPSLEKFENKVRSGGIIIVNSDVCDVLVKRQDVKVVYVNVLTVAGELGNNKMSNTVMLGVVKKYCDVLTDESYIGGIKYLLGSKPKLLEANFAAYNKGKTL